MSNTTPSAKEFLAGKTPAALDLYDYFVESFQQIGNVYLHPTKTMIGIANGDKKVAWITAIGKNFVHVVFLYKTL